MSKSARMNLLKYLQNATSFDDNESSVYYLCYAIQDNVHYKIKDWFNNN